MSELPRFVELAPCYWETPDEHLAILHIAAYEYVLYVDGKVHSTHGSLSEAVGAADRLVLR